MAPDKKRSADKIDDMAALLMAIGASSFELEEEDDEDFMNAIRKPIIA